MNHAEVTKFTQLNSRLYSNVIFLNNFIWVFILRKCQIWRKRLGDYNYFSQWSLNLIEICLWNEKEKKNTSCALFFKCYSLNSSVACITMNKKCWCCLRCNAVKKVFIGTFVKGGSLLAFFFFYRKCWEPIIQRCDAVRSLQVLSSLLTPCQCCSLGNGTVESPPPPPQLG